MDWVGIRSTHDHPSRISDLTEPEKKKGGKMVGGNWGEKENSGQRISKVWVWESKRKERSPTKGGGEVGGIRKERKDQTC